jgi:hypothetical protein
LNSLSFAGREPSQPHEYALRRGSRRNPPSVLGTLNDVESQPSLPFLDDHRAVSTLRPVNVLFNALTAQSPERSGDC